MRRNYYKRNDEKLSKYKSAIFDLGLTLIYSPRVKNFINICKKFGMCPNEEDVKRAFTFTDYYFMKNRPGVLGRQPKDFYMEYLAVMFAYLHLEPNIKDFYKVLFEECPPRKEWKLYDESIPFLNKLKEQGFKLGLLSNWDLSARIILDKLCLTDYFDSIIISSEIGIEKPAKEAFIRSLESLNVHPDEAFYVGDNYFDDVKGGNQVGLKVFLLNRTDKACRFKEGNFKEVNSLMEILNYI
jgi:putative hydrolase of the HAD superfamily